ncbi:MAG TPA: GGDEF domain-containing protein [Solirubrobacteraceae bacterium]|nr:GGDEF domain-containing protein [Solirubrobacteraceae bacterium]
MRRVTPVSIERGDHREVERLAKLSPLVLADALVAYRRAMQALASGEPVEVVLDGLCAYVDRQVPATRCAVLIVDREDALIRQLAAPALEPEFAALVDGLRVSEGFGPWGASAARCEPVVVEDVESDPLVRDFAETLDGLGVRSLWVEPVRRASGEVVALITLYSADRRLPTERERELIVNVSNIVELAIERDLLNEEMRFSANHDPLTGTLNRVRFMELVNERITSSADRVAVICLEIDRFKPLRLTLGAHAGDRLLAEVGRRLLEVAGDTGLVGHFNGDEFGLMVPAEALANVDAVAEALMASFRLPIVLGQGEFFLTLSLGIAYNNGVTDAYSLVREGAAAMHAARADGFGRHRVYDHRIGTQLLDSIEREVELRRAIDSDELVIHYQPLLRLADRVWDRAETLVRWQHPTRGLIGPGEFIPLAEQSGLMGALGDKVLELVIAEAERWSQTLPGVQLSVNISGIQLRRPNFGDRVLTMLEAAGLPPATLLFEVTESAILQDVAAAQAILSQLRQAGIRTAIDDFGTGYSSLARLGELPITGVKIDRAFVAGLGNDDKAREIFKAIADIVRAHGLLIIAEGIEDARALAEIDAFGCDFAQGYHLCRPGPPEVITAMLAAPVPERLWRVAE